MTITKTGIFDGNVPDFLLDFSKMSDEDPWILTYTSERVFFTKGNCLDLLKRLSQEKSFLLLELRAFTTTWELHMWSWNGKHRWRLLQDDEKKLRDVYDEEHILWGNSWDSNRESSFQLVEKGRGSSIGFPQGMEGTVLPITMGVRNYYEYDKDGLINFKDARLLWLKDAEGREL